MGKRIKVGRHKVKIPFELISRVGVDSRGYWMCVGSSYAIVLIPRHVYRRLYVVLKERDA